MTLYGVFLLKTVAYSTTADSPQMQFWTHQGLYSLSGKMSYRKISLSLETARFGFKFFPSLWNLTGTSAAALPRCPSNFRAIQSL